MKTHSTAELRQKIKELKEDVRIMKGAYFATFEDLQKALRENRTLRKRLGSVMEITYTTKN